MACPVASYADTSAVTGRAEAWVDREAWKQRATSVLSRTPKSWQQLFHYRRRRHGKTWGGTFVTHRMIRRNRPALDVVASCT
mmetsp:Transcript_26892/g.61970  ORF Transcript_26892/g.61970 Transcript_26892/m.61970 type:complete len:82 (-) Transcript_26892:272-517(-)